MAQNNPFAKLGALDQQLYQETTAKRPENQQESTREQTDAKSKDKQKKGENLKGKSQHASIPETQKAGKLASKQSSIPAFHRSSSLELQHTQTPTEKVTYRFHPEGKYAIEDIKTILARKIGVKASCELIAEVAILIAYGDLLENQHASMLAKRLSSMPETQKSS
jgi:hypothetical protein